MTTYAVTSQPSTPDSTKAVAQSRSPDVHTGATQSTEDEYSGLNRHFRVEEGVARAIHAHPYERKVDDPIYRPLRIYALDPARSQLQGGIAVVNVPYEPLTQGPRGALLEIVDYDETEGRAYPPVDLEDPRILIQSGNWPSPSDHLFHQQMVYAVGATVYAAFQKALGRHLAWGFRRPPAAGEENFRLRIRPHWKLEANAHYDKYTGEVCFGYFRAGSKVSGRNIPNGFVFTCLSHDIVVHEITHALLDGLREHFHVPSSPDVLAFHEAFADLMAIFQRFSYDKVVLAAIQTSRGNIDQSDALTRLAQQFGETTGNYRALRQAIDERDHDGNPTRTYENQRTAEPHVLGSVLVAAIFEAFLTVYRRKTKRYVRLATRGTGELLPGDLPADLQDILARQASKLANQFMTICIRAIDYCPPVDLQAGDYLRALITADHDLVPDDPWGYREALIDAFARRKIYPTHVKSLAEDALLWRPPDTPIDTIEELTFAKLQFQGDPSHPAGSDELKRQACALGRIIAQPRYMKEFGLMRPQDPRLGGEDIGLPEIESIRTSRRVGPDGQIVFDLVAEVTQQRIVRRMNGRGKFTFYGGSTVILGPSGEIRYVISKSIAGDERREHQQAFVEGDGKRYWIRGDKGNLVPHPQLFRFLHHTD
ncbi:MAG TPA: hypothetical protein VLA19_18740 [Herpetosiphonaceae bacterium]|nr:hypothetical protein [Herpetosiphonaceae bacterium]